MRFPEHQPTSVPNPGSQELFQLQFLLNRPITGCGFQSVPKITMARGTLGKFYPFFGHQLLGLNMTGMNCVTSKDLSILQL